MNRGRLALSLAVLVAVAAAAPRARADPPAVDEEARASARVLGDQAVELFEAGDYAKALDLFSRADAIVHLPTTGLYVARCLVKLGRLIDAEAKYAAVTRIALDSSALAVHKKAQEDADIERTALLPRIPRLTLSLTGAGTGDATVTLDGRAVPTALVGMPQLVDPGRHAITAARAGARSASIDLTLREGESRPVSLALEAAPAPALASAPPSPELPTAASSGGPWRTVGWSALAVGGVGLVIGTVAGAVAISKKSNLDAECPSERCGPPFYGDVDSYDTARALSTTGFVVGAVGLATGAVVLLAAPHPAPATAWIAPGRAGLTLRF